MQKTNEEILLSDAKLFLKLAQYKMPFGRYQGVLVN